MRLGASFGVPDDVLERLQKANHHERDLVVRKLLAEANPGSCVEWEEYERVWDEVFLEPLVQETVWVEFQGIRPP